MLCSASSSCPTTPLAGLPTLRRRFSSSSARPARTPHKTSLLPFGLPACRQKSDLDRPAGAAGSSILPAVGDAPGGRAGRRTALHAWSERRRDRLRPENRPSGEDLGSEVGTRGGRSLGHEFGRFVRAEALHREVARI